jgi:hypothetical protein
MLARDELLSAALRHARDAEHLLDASDNQSVDQAYHLSGFAAECARKACLADPWGNKAIGHDLGSNSDTVLATLLSQDVFAARYDLEGWEGRFPGLSRWNVGSRYRPTAHGSARLQAVVDAQTVVQEARSIVDRLALALYADGAVTAEAFAT